MNYFSLNQKLKRYLSWLMIRYKKPFHKMLPLNTLVVLLCLFGSCKKETNLSTPSKVSIYQIAAEDVTNFSFLKAVIDKAGLKEKLDNSGNFTLFAPTNQAFQDAGYPSIASVNNLSESEALTLLQHHLFSEKIQVKGLGDQKIIIAEDQRPLALNANPLSLRDSSFTQFLVDGADIISPDLNAVNGNVQVVNRLLVYNNKSILETLSEDSKYSLFIIALNRASEGSVNYNVLLSGTEDFTVFAPVNTAFSAYKNGMYDSEAKIMATDPDIIGQLVGYHIIKGRFFGFQLPETAQSLTQNDIIITKLATDNKVRTSNAGSTFLANGVDFRGFNANKVVKNGIINTLSTVLDRPSSLNTLAYIQSQPDLTFLAAAITRVSQDSVNFNQYFSGTNRYTIFAPNDNAFKADGYPTLSAISSASSSSLSAILKLHIVKGAVYSAVLTSDDLSVKTVSGVNIILSKSGTNYYVKGPNNTADGNVIASDQVTKTGVINKINLLLK